MTANSQDRRIFVDTSAFFAVASRRDSSHVAMSETMLSLSRSRRHFVTTNFILAELHALILARGRSSTALTTISGIITSPTVSVVRVRASDEERAMEILTQYGDKTFSLTDAISFAVMERLGIDHVLTTDHHFAQFGWSVVPIVEP